MTVGERIKNRRNELGMTQTDLAAKMGYSDKTGVSKAETRGDNITTTKIAKFAEALNCSFEYLMGWEETSDYVSPIAQTINDLSEIAEDPKLIDMFNKIKSLSNEKKEALYKYIDFLSSTGD